MSVVTVPEDLSVDEFFRTNDMAMATFLKLRGHAVQVVAWIQGTCYWVFRANDSLLACVDEFTSDEALVNPREYNRVFTLTKREFYDNRPQG